MLDNLKNMVARKLLTEAQIAAALRFKRHPNLVFLPPSLHRILREILIDNVGIEDYEKQRGWAARSAKSILAVALDTLVEHRNGFSQDQAHRDEVSAQEYLDYITAANCDVELIPYILHYNMTETEVRIFLMLLRATEGRCTTEYLHRGLYYHLPDDAPDEKIIDVYICKLRKKLLKDERYVISTVHDVGYMIVDSAMWKHAPDESSPNDKSIHTH